MLVSIPYMDPMGMAIYTFISAALHGSVTGTPKQITCFERFEKYKSVKVLRPFGDLFSGIDVFDGISQ